jgi:hypothetical protein
MNRNLLLLILVIPNIFYCQSAFKISESKNVHSKVINILNEKNIFPSNVQASEINITDLIDSENKVDDNITNGIFSIYYHYNWNSYLLFKNKNEFILYTEPLKNTESIFKKVLGIDKTKKESKEYLKQIYNHLYYLIENKNNKGFRVISTNRKEYEKNEKQFKKDKKKMLHSEQKRLKKEYHYYLDLIRKR